MSHSRYADFYRADFHLTNYQVSDFFELKYFRLLLKTVKKESKTSELLLL